MTNTTFTTMIARIALPVVIGGAALGMAGVASAQTGPFGPGYQYAPTTTAEPAHRCPQQPPRRGPRRGNGPRLPPLTSPQQRPLPTWGGASPIAQ